MIERLAIENPAEFSGLIDPMKKASTVRYREYLRETLQENQRKGNYIRIYPAKNSDMYDQYFGTQRPYNKVIYKVLYTDEVLRGSYETHQTGVRAGSQKLEAPISAYEQYKKQQQEKVA